MLQISLATENDLVEILSLQRAAYQSEAEIYRDWSIQPLTQSLEQLRKEFETKLILKATEDKKIVGSIRVHVQEGIGFIEKLITQPDEQQRGIGSALLKTAEEELKGITQFRLFTGQLSIKNLAFYEKRGYREFNREVISDNLTLVWMRKTKGFYDQRE
ncbi:MAG TPA: GNAT family N-acetyltransferase [bacterium]|jgi:N-acetylglutamate synthase-like GNAT family acetyltransferase|nr:GNAT family N-acetyltransferase [bacterium]